MLVLALFVSSCDLFPSDDDSADTTAPAAVTGMTPSDGYATTESSYTLSWTAVDGAAKYQVQLASSEGGVASATAVEVSATSYTPSDAPDHFWYWRVRAVNSSGQSGDWSDIYSLTVDWSNVAISGLSPASGAETTDTTPSLTWTEAPGAASYEIQIASSSLGVSAATAITSTSASYAPTSPLDNQSAYYWRVRAVDSSDNATAWSDIVTFTVNWTTSGPADGIRFPSELAYIATYVSTYGAGTYTLGADLDLSGLSWTPIGTSTNKFTGTFDGNGHTISNLTISANTSGYQGLFGYIGSGGSVNDLTLTSASVSSTGNYVGGLAGYSQGSVTDCSVAGSVSGAQYTGGLAGYCTGITVTNCSVSGTVTGSGNNTGGLIGFGSESTVTLCSSSATVSGTSSVGGIVGYGSTGSIEQCYTAGSVSGTGYPIGGIIGYSNSTDIINSYSTGTISGGQQCGGLAGYKVPASVFSNSYASGSVSGSANLGGLIGASSSTAYITGCFFDSETVGTTAAASSYGTGATTAEMQTKSTFTDAGWDFPGETANGTDDIWEITSGYNGGYPYLLNNLPSE